MSRVHVHVHLPPCPDNACVPRHARAGIRKLGSHFGKSKGSPRQARNEWVPSAQSGNPQPAIQPKGLDLCLSIGTLLIVDHQEKAERRPQCFTRTQQICCSHRSKVQHWYPISIEMLSACFSTLTRPSFSPKIFRLIQSLFQHHVKRENRKIC